MDIRMYTYFGEYNREVDQSTKESMVDMQTDVDMNYVREHMYTDQQRKKLNDFDTLAKQMIGQRFAFMSNDGTVISGKVKSYSWDEHKVTIEFQLILDNEPDADIEYSACVHSGLHVYEDTVIITEDSTPMPFDPEGVAANSFKVIM